MKRVLLQFPTLLALIDFTLIVDSTNCEINRTAFTLSCRLTTADIELATRGFNATILEYKKV